MKTAILLSCVLFTFCSCKHDETQTSEPHETETRRSSQKLALDFPLLPVIEGALWQKLQQAEAVSSDHQATEKQRSDATAEASRIIDRLQQKHPFRKEEKRVSLGGIVYDRESGNIEIPVVVSYPKNGDQRHPGELELVLCSTTGRSHETLFTTDTRPLHLELLLHLAGYRKSPPASTFKLEVITPNHDAIPIESLIKSAGSDDLPERFLWEFSGGEFKDPYLPDMTGDFLICWHAHESVLRIRQEEIASGEFKLKPVTHPALMQHQAVTLVLSPE